MTTKNIEQKVMELKELQRMSEELTAEIESIKDELKKEMELRKTDELTTATFKVRYTTVTTNRFDTTSFKKDYGNLYNQFVKTTVTRRFTVA